MVSQSDLARRRAAAKTARASGAVPTVKEAVVPDAVSPPTEAHAIVVDAVASKPRSVALPQANVDRARQLTDRDFVMPKLKMAQGLSKVVQSQTVKLGHWYHTTRNEDLGTSVLFIPVDMRKSRSYFVNGQGILCRSFDMVQGEGTPGILCEGEEDEYYMPEKDRGCPLRLWTKNEATGKSKKPDCGVNFNYLGVVLLDGTTEGRISRAILTFRGTASRTAKDINTLVSEFSVDPLNPDWPSSILRLNIDSRTNSFGTFSVPVMEYIGPTAEHPRLVEAANALRGLANPNVYRASMEADQDDD